MHISRSLLMFGLGAGLLLSADITHANPARYYIQNLQTNQVLTAQGNISNHATTTPAVTLEWMVFQNPRQIWYLEPIHGYRNKYFIRNVVSGRYLDAHGHTHLAITYPRNSGYSDNQVWTVNGRTGRIQAQGRFGCLDAYLKGGKFGPTVGTWPCHDGKNQQWYLANAGYY
jgi:hypothetical protein